eukprot:1029856-Prorocentrum_minimum.AAC.1
MARTMIGASGFPASAWPLAMPCGGNVFCFRCVEAVQVLRMQRGDPLKCRYPTFRHPTFRHPTFRHPTFRVFGCIPMASESA